MKTGKFEAFTFTLLTLLVVFYVWPAAWWLEVDSVEVTSAPTGQNLVLFEREIDRDFQGAYTVVIRDINRTITCTGGDELTYREDAKLPDEITLDWWTNGECEILPVGSYTMFTEWEIKLPFGFSKFVRSTSPLFQVFELEDKTEVDELREEQRELQAEVESLSRSLKAVTE